MEVEKSKLSVGLIGFKSASYANWDPQVFIAASSNDTDWAGLYVAEDESVAEGYLVDCVPTGGNGTAYIHKVGIKSEVPLLVCKDKAFEGGVESIDMEALRRAVREQGVAIGDGPFMPELGRLGYCFRCPNNDEGAFEVIVPVPLAVAIIMQPYKKCTVKNYVAQCSTL